MLQLIRLLWLGLARAAGMPASTLRSAAIDSSSSTAPRRPAGSVRASVPVSNRAM
ncbi:MAG: hypothetical protein HYY76_09735 [Acidobacteria bacterium]|nr:hypothetical protein [Acidobacteriota bacterium]